MTAATLPRPAGVYPKGDVDLTRFTDWATLEALDWEVVPFHLGPTWDLDPNWDGPRHPDGYKLPKWTLGWQVIDWIEENLLADETDEFDKSLPFSLTSEQRRFLLWFYAVDENGRFLYREVVLQRLKGWGKDPLAACIAAVEFVGPCRFAGWATQDIPEHGILKGEPFAKPHPRAWVQIAAVSLKQTQNTMKLFLGLFTDECKAQHSIDIGKETIYAYQGKKTIEAVTSSPASLEGNRPTLVIKNETHHWKANNEGLEMAAAIERNSTKAKGGAARTLSITNAYEPGEKSVARDEREAYELQAQGLAYATEIMYDSLEAPKDARLKARLPDDEKDYNGPQIPAALRETLTRRYLRRVLEAARGGAWWLDIVSLTNSILDSKNPPSRSRRFWYNQVVAAEDAWLDALAIKASISQMAVESRERNLRGAREALEAGWLVAPEEPVVLFFDGSKSDDATGIVGCRLSDGYTFTVGVWQAPPKARNEKKTWLAPREAVTQRLVEAFTRLNVVAFWGDPSHTKDDDDGTRYWDGFFDRWMQLFTVDDPQGRWKAIDAKFWSIKGGHRKHAIVFDMAGPDQQKLFVAAAEEFVEVMENLNDIEEYDPLIQIDGHPALVNHLENAVRHPGNWGTSLMKESRESPKKIDLAVCAVGARMLRRIVMNTLPEEEEEKPSGVWGVW